MLKLNFKELHELSLSDPEKVWDEFGKEVSWSKPYKSVLNDKESPIPNWYIGGEINMSYNCLDKAIEEGYGDDVAVVYESPVTNTSQEITFKELLGSVELLAGVMVQKFGIQKGDIVLLYFPEIPQCLIAMLACTRVGAIFNVVFSGLSAKSISARIDETESKLIMISNVNFDQSGLINCKGKIDAAIQMSGYKSTQCLVYNRPDTEPAKMIEGRDLDWDTEIEVASPQGPIPLQSNHPMFLSYTSGVAGEPRGFVFQTGSTAVHYKYIMKYILDIKPREGWWMMGDFVWLCGQIYSSFGPLLARCKTIIYEGKYESFKDSENILRILNRHKVVSFFSTPTVLRILKYNSYDMALDLSFDDLRAIYISGDYSGPDIRKWGSTFFKCPVYNVWGSTELNSGINMQCLGLGRPINASPVATLGVKFKIVDSETGDECPPGVNGDILVKLPMYPSIATTLFKDHERYLKTYFTNYPVGK